MLVAMPQPMFETVLAFQQRCPVPRNCAVSKPYTQNIAARRRHNLAALDICAIACSCTVEEGFTQAAQFVSLVLKYIRLIAPSRNTLRFSSCFKPFQSSVCPRECARQPRAQHPSHYEHRPRQPVFHGHCAPRRRPRKHLESLCRCRRSPRRRFDFCCLSCALTASTLMRVVQLILQCWIIG